MIYKPDGNAAEIYEALKPIRDNFLKRAERSSALTIPMLIPRDSERRTGSIAEFDTPRQGIGARGVNHLSSRLLLTLLPSGAPFFKYSIDAFALDQLSQLDPNVQSQVKATLAQIEDSVHHYVETEALRVPSAEICKHLIVAGNACQAFPKRGGMTFYPLSQYVCVRDPDGDEVMDFVLRECIDKAALDPKLLKLYEASLKQLQYEGTKAPKAPKNSSESSEEYVEIYTRQYLEDKKYYVRQEFSNGLVIPGSEGSYKVDAVPYNPLRWTKVPGEAYGRGLIEEYIGDLIFLEALSQALIEGALASARVVGLVRPNSSTHPSDINNAKNGEFITGVEDDVKFLQVEKYADLRTASETGARIEKRLESAFLLNSSVTRNAERVTAEEIRYVAQELETALGGVYSILAHEFQLPLVKMILARLEKKGVIPRFPPSLKEKVKPVIITGVDALGRNAELERLRAAFTIFASIVGPEMAASVMKPGNVGTFVFSQAGVTTKGLIMTPQEIATQNAEKQRMAALQETISKGVGPAVNAVSKATSEQQGVQK